MNWRWCLLGLALQLPCALCSSPFVQDIQVVSMLPAPRSAGDTVQLNHKQALTVVFNRPIIALGSDFLDAPLDIDTDTQFSSGWVTDPHEATVRSPLTFTLQSGGRIQGSVRWVTTFIVRFDPTDTWSSDLAFDVSLRTGFQTFDGVVLALPQSWSFLTRSLSMRMGDVTSERATLLTGSLWNARLAAEKGAEVPPDGVVTLRFNSPVEYELISQALQLQQGEQVVSSGASTEELAGAFFRTEKCPQADDDACVRVLPRNLAVDTGYALVLPRGISYHASSGTLQSPSTFSLAGLYPFSFPFRQPDRWFKPSYRRHRLWLRHGLSPDVSLDAFQSAISIRQGSTELEFTVSRPDNGTLQLHADFQPERAYVVSVQASESITDGFGLPLRASSVTFNTSRLPSFFVDADTPASTGMLLPPSWLDEDGGGNWRVLSRGGGDTNKQHVSMYPVSDQGVSRVLGWTSYAYPGAPLSPSGPTVAQPDSGEFDVQHLELPIEDSTGSSQVFLRERWNRNTGSRGFSSKDLVVVSDLVLSSVADKNGTVLVYVSELVTGDGVAGVEVVLYGMESRGQNPVFVTANGVSDQHGVVVLALEGKYDELFLYARETDDNGDLSRVSVLADVPRLGFATGDNSYLRLSAITDRGVYKPGEDVHVKVYGRRLLGTEWATPDVRTRWYFAEVTWKESSGRGAGRQSSVKSRVLLEWDASFGSASLTLAVPEDSSMGHKTVSVYSAPGVEAPDDLSTITEREFISSFSILVADPRRPTASMDFTSVDVVYKPDAQWPGLALRLVVQTDTGLPIADAAVEVRWTWQRKVNAEEQQEESTVARNGVLTQSTGGDGMASFVFNLPGQAKEGESLSLTAQWVGPTGELLESTLSFPVRASRFVFSPLTTSVPSPLPGLPFRVTASLRSEDDSAQMGQDIRLFLARWSEGITAQEVVDEHDTACDETSGTPSQCELLLSFADKYVVLASYTDTEDQERGPVQVYSDLLEVGRTAQEWTMRPLASLQQSVVMTLDKEAYALGDTPQVSLYNPFRNARLLLRWGNSVSASRHDVVSGVAFGWTSVSFPAPLSDECIGGCTLFAALVVPAQGEDAVLPVPLPVSRLLDVRAPGVFASTLIVEVPDQDTALTATVRVPNDGRASPREVVQLEVIVDVDGGMEDGEVEVCLMVVDKAFLQLKPHPLARPHTSFVRDLKGSMVHRDGREDLVLPSGMDAVVDTFTSRVQQDPWIQPQWPTESRWGADVDQSDDTFFARLTSDITQFPARPWRGSPAWDGRKRFGKAGPVAQAMVASDGAVRFKGGIISPTSVESNAMPPTMAMSRTADEADTASMGGGGGGGGDAKESVPFLEPRSKFETAPLFTTVVVSVEGGSATALVDLPLPDNIATFVVRAFVAGSDLRLGADEAELVSAQDVNMAPSLPRFVRNGDSFEAGVSLTTSSTSFSDVLRVDVSTPNATLTLPDNASLSHKVVGVGPVPFLVRMDAEEEGTALLHFAATRQGMVVDAMQRSLRVVKVQDAISVATSMAIQARQSPESAQWGERVVFPEGASDGTLQLRAGVGRLAAMESLVESLLRRAVENTDTGAWIQTTDTRSTADLWLSLAGVMQALPSASPVGQRLRGFMKPVRQRLSDLTNGVVGLMYSHSYMRWMQHASADLNARALFLTGRDEDMSRMLFTERSVWRRVLVQELKRQVAEARPYVWKNLHALAWTYAALGTAAEKEHGLGELLELRFARLTEEPLSTDVTVQALTAWLLIQEGKSGDPFVQTVVNGFISSLRVQGRTAYATRPGTGQASGLSMQSQALVLSVLSVHPSVEVSHHPLVEKLANFVAQGDVSGVWLWRVSELTEALSALALQDYDAAHESMDPDVKFSVDSGAVSILQQTFDRPGMPVAVANKPWSELAQEGDAPPDLVFSASGRGEVSVALLLSFVPPLLPDPVFRGIFVERLLFRVDPATGKATGDPVQAVAGKDLVQVRLQLSTPDDLSDVILVDLLPAGLEPRDANLDQGQVKDMPTSGNAYRSIWRNPLTGPETRTDRMTWTAMWLRAGVYSVTYSAVAVTPGVFRWPAARAHVQSQPEIMGMSGAGHFVVTGEAMSAYTREESDAVLQRMGVPAMQLLSVPKGCSVECAAGCNLRTGECYQASSLVAGSDSDAVEDVTPPVIRDTASDQGSIRTSVCILAALLAVVGLFLVGKWCLRKRTRRLNRSPPAVGNKSLSRSTSATSQELLQPSKRRSVRESEVEVQLRERERPHLDVE